MITIVIPARMGSTRLKEKALADICGKPMIQHVWERAQKVRSPDNSKIEVIVATDHPRIEQAVKGFGGQVVMTSDQLQSGTDRVAAVARERTPNAGLDVYVNVQGDEPLLDPFSVERCIALILEGGFRMSTPAAPLKDVESLHNPNVVKVLIAHDRRAVYFSRYPIPYSRGPEPKDPKEISPRHHLGVYAYTRETLLKFADLSRSPWEAAESLEQLRALYHGIAIGVAQADVATCGVDTAEDLETVRKVIARSR